MEFIFTISLLAIAIAVSRWTSQYSPPEDLLVNESFEARFFTRVFPFAGKWRAYVAPLHEKRMLEYSRRLGWSYLLLGFILVSFIVLERLIN